MALRNDHDLERPGRPPWTPCPEATVLEDSPLALLTLKLGVVLEQIAAALLAPVVLQVEKLKARLFGKGGSRPDLTVRVRIRAAHSTALVLEDLHVPVLLVRLVDDVAIWC